MSCRRNQSIASSLTISTLQCWKTLSIHTQKHKGIASKNATAHFWTGTHSQHIFPRKKSRLLLVDRGDTYLSYLSRCANYLASRVLQF